MNQTSVCQECGTSHVVTECPRSLPRRVDRVIDRLRIMVGMCEQKALTAASVKERVRHQSQRDAMAEALDVVERGLKG